MSVLIPVKVRACARIGLALKKKGFEGSIATGLKRGMQLATHKIIPLKDLAVMRAWFARHGPDAANGGTSYRGYRRWIDNKCPGLRTKATRQDLSRYRGAVAWLLWGGDAAYLWLKKKRVRVALRIKYPRLRAARPGNFLRPAGRERGA